MEEMFKIIEGPSPYKKLTKDSFSKEPHSMMVCPDDCSHFGDAKIRDELAGVLKELQSKISNNAKSVLAREVHFELKKGNKGSLCPKICMLGNLLIPLGFIVRPTIEGTFIYVWGDGQLYLPNPGMLDAYANGGGKINWPASFEGYILVQPPVDYDKEWQVEELMDITLADVEIE
jgi:hypothetical protein